MSELKPGKVAGIVVEDNATGVADEIVGNAQQLVTYSNLVGVSLSPEEAFFHFGQRHAENPNLADGVAKVYVSLPAFKRITANLQRILTQYEEIFGEIPDPLKLITEETKQKALNFKKSSQ